MPIDCNELNIHPEPMGSMIPSLVGSHNGNSEDTPGWLILLCPSCDSENVCVLDPTFNPELHKYETRWFCISCSESWTYVRDDE